MDKLFAEFNLKGLTLNNRIVMPPVFTHAFSDTEGRPKPEKFAHYEKIARGGAGLIIVEAACVEPRARLAPTQLGIWDDIFIPDLKKIADLIHDNGAKAFIQIHHAGFKTFGPEKISASDYEMQSMNELVRARAMRADEIKATQDNFVKAALRAQTAGFDGVEIHAAHGYLITQFLSTKANRRTDDYGGSLENRARFGVETIGMVKKALDDHIVVGVRMGSNEPSLEDSLYFAQQFVKAGADILHVSTGFDNQRPAEMKAPEDFGLSWIVYGASCIKARVDVPVIAVSGVRTPDQVRKIVDQDLADLVALGRAQLVDPDWVRKARNHEKIVMCHACKACQWFADYRKCLGHIDPIEA